MLELKQHALHTRITPKIMRDYSLFKFGNIKNIRKYRKIFTKLIKKYIDPAKKNYLFTANKYPLNNFCKKNSTILSQQVAKDLKLKLLVMEYKYTYNPENFYDNTTKRKAIPHHKQILKYESKIKGKDNHIIIIDDSTVTGKTLDTFKNRIKKFSRSADAFFIIKKNIASGEKKLNDAAYKNIHSLIKIIREKDYTFTTHMIRTIKDMPPTKKREFLRGLPRTKKINFLKAFKIYTGNVFKV